MIPTAHQDTVSYPKEFLRGFSASMQFVEFYSVLRFTHFLHCCSYSSHLSACHSSAQARARPGHSTQTELHASVPKPIRSVFYLTEFLVFYNCIFIGVNETVWRKGMLSCAFRGSTCAWFPPNRCVEWRRRDSHRKVRAFAAISLKR